MERLPVLALLLFFALPLNEAGNLNYRPIIGILAQRCSDEDLRYGDTYVRGMYVKWVQSGGARVVPIRVRENQSYYEDIFKSINGVVFPGGHVDVITSDYSKAATILYNKAIQAYDKGDYFPIWGTCKGFQLLTALTSGQNLLSAREVLGMRPLLLTNDFAKSRLFGSLPKDILKLLTSHNVTANHHIMGLSTTNYTHSKRLSTFYRMLSKNLADNGKYFVSTLEGIKYPFYGTQWHPEKIPFLWDLTDPLIHRLRGIKVSQYFADFFVQECRKSSHRFRSFETELDSIISNVPPRFSHDERFMEFYYFNYTKNTSN